LRHAFSVLTVLIGIALFASEPTDSSYPPQQLLDRITAQGIRSHMEYLADDLLEGRGTGTRGYLLAANYIRAHFEQMGLKLAGDSGSYFQKIRFREVKPAPERDSLVIKRNNAEEKLVFEKDYLMSGHATHEDAKVEAPMVWVGYGVTVPELHYDDYAGIDARGKIIVAVRGAPSSLPSSDRAVYSDGIRKARNAAAHGAIGRITIWAGEIAKQVPWEQVVHFYHSPSMYWLDEKDNPNDYVPEILATALVNGQFAEPLFRGSGHTLDEAMASLNANKPMSFALSGTASLHDVARFSEKESPNVAAILPGSDSQFKNEYVVFTAHADHMGIGEPIKGQTIYHGAADNASGTAALLEIARAFAESGPRPKRSLLFVAVTGEEMGLLGSDYFAHHPTVPIEQIAANINMDGVSLFYDFRDIVALGAEHSTLDRQIRDVAQHMGLEVSPDPMPEQVFFIRSDQYSFVKRGVPAVMIGEGFKTVDPTLDGKKIFLDWMSTHYHTPQDDMTQPLNFDAARKCTQINLAVGYEVAEAADRPHWNSGDTFGKLFANK